MAYRIREIAPSILVVALFLCLILLEQVTLRPAQAAETQDPRLEEVNRLYKQGDNAAALKKVEQILASDAKSDQASFAKGLILGELGKSEEQLEWWRVCVNRFPADTGYRKLLAEALMQKDRFGEAVTQYNKVLELDPKMGAAFVGRAQCYLLMGQYEQADSDLKSGDELAGDKNRALLDMLQGWVRKLLRQFRAVDLPPKGWAPNYADYITIYEDFHTDAMLVKTMVDKLDDLPKAGPGQAVSAAGAPGSKFGFRGSESAPLKFAPALYVWDGAWINDPKYGCLLTNGTKFKHVRIDNERKVAEFGHVEGWKFQVDRTASIGHP